MKRVSKLGLAAVCSLAAISVVSAQRGPQTPEQKAQMAVKVRQSLFEVQSYSFGPAAAMLRPGSNFDPKVAETAAKRVEMTSSMIPDVFKFDTRKFTVTTKARDDIWMNMSDFAQKAQALNMAAQNLAMVAMSGDRSATVRAIGMVGKACGNCHDQFRNK
ncbi:MAG: c-type cytochrome [Steroidobacteraceae bacterium]